jgi:hypothetical protein
MDPGNLMPSHVSLELGVRRENELLAILRSREGEAPRSDLVAVALGFSRARGYGKRGASWYFVF